MSVYVKEKTAILILSEGRHGIAVGWCEEKRGLSHLRGLFLSS
jgi:hypothetical protein